MRNAGPSDYSLLSGKTCLFDVPAARTEGNQTSMFHLLQLCEQLVKTIALCCGLSWWCWQSFEASDGFLFQCQTSVLHTQRHYLRKKKRTQLKLKCFQFARTLVRNLRLLVIERVQCGFSLFNVLIEPDLVFVKEDLLHVPFGRNWPRWPRECDYWNCSIVSLLLFIFVWSELAARSVGFALRAAWRWKHHCTLIRVERLLRCLSGGCY